jgi:DNA-binding NarL/FixJ family response regulator
MGNVWNVLVVDDELTVVATAATAVEALQRAAETHPDLVILDHLLGGPVTGLQVADQLRDAFPATRVILFSAADDVIDLREHSVDAVLGKMDIGDLPTVARRVLAAQP